MECMVVGGRAEELQEGSAAITRVRKSLAPDDRTIQWEDWIDCQVRIEVVGEFGAFEGVSCSILESDVRCQQVKQQFPEVDWSWDFGDADLVTSTNFVDAPRWAWMRVSSDAKNSSRLLACDPVDPSVVVGRCCDCWKWGSLGDRVVFMSSTNLLAAGCKEENEPRIVVISCLTGETRRMLTEEIVKPTTSEYLTPPALSAGPRKLDPCLISFDCGSGVNLWSLAVREDSPVIASYQYRAPDLYGRENFRNLRFTQALVFKDSQIVGMCRGLSALVTWDVATQKVLRKLDTPSFCTSLAIANTSNGDLLVTFVGFSRTQHCCRSSYGGIRTWDLKTKHQTSTQISRKGTNSNVVTCGHVVVAALTSGMAAWDVRQPSEPFLRKAVLPSREDCFRTCRFRVAGESCRFVSQSRRYLSSWDLSGKVTHLRIHALRYPDDTILPLSVME